MIRFLLILIKDMSFYSWYIVVLLICKIFLLFCLVHTTVLLFSCLFILIFFIFFSYMHSFLLISITFIFLFDLSSSCLRGMYLHKIDYNYNGWHLLSNHLAVIYIYSGRHVLSGHLESWNYTFFPRVIQPSLSFFVFFMNFMASFFVIWLACINS